MARLLALVWLLPGVVIGAAITAFGFMLLEPAPVLLDCPSTYEVTPDAYRTSPRGK